MNNQAKIQGDHSDENDENENSLTRRRLLSMAAVAGASCLAPAPLFAASAQPGATNVTLSELDLSLVDQEWNVAGMNQSVSQKPLRIAGRTFANGVGTHAQSRILVRLDKKTRRFRALVGVDDGAGEKASVIFSVVGDGRQLWQSAVLKRGEAPIPLDLDVSKVSWLSLNVDGAGDGVADDHANWVEATFEGVSKRPLILARAPVDEPYILSGRLWLDQNSRHIQAHGGGIMRHGGKWWWHGEDRSDGYIAIGASAYFSSDLRHWTHAGVALPRAAYDQKHGDQTLCERPKVVYNPLTKKFVMWFHYDRSGYGDSRAGVAISDRPAGPFLTLGQHRPIESSTFRDMNLWVDDDGLAYVFYSGEENQTMHVVRLNAQWTAPQMPMIEGQTWNRILIGQAREAPAPFKYAGKYFLLTSGTSGWSPNRADLSVADTPLGPYVSLGDPFVGVDAELTFRSQSTSVLPMPDAAPGHFIYLGDRWKPESLADSRYVWLPFLMSDTNDQSPRIEWNPRWK